MRTAAEKSAALLLDYNLRTAEIRSETVFQHAARNCQALRQKQNAILLAIRRMIAVWSISSRAPWLLSVTESLALPPEHKGGHMSKTPTFNLREWLVPPVLMPIFLVLLVAAAMVIQW